MFGTNRLIALRLYNRNVAFRGVRGVLTPFTLWYHHTATTCPQKQHTVQIDPHSSMI